ncbi:hypothetical protein [Methylocaldum gracile]|jgi:hypothetical protein|uniref:hypothetical protein n=1 Tax=unclassified Methylocaldum TaxID=2622260 RepID=UPI0010F170D2
MKLDKASITGFGFTDTSTASPIEKARRVLTALAQESNPKYYFSDGYPRYEEIHKDAAATLKVLNTLTATLPTPNEVDEYIQSLKWNNETDDYARTLVAGNIRCFVAWLVRRSIP